MRRMVVAVALAVVIGGCASVRQPADLPGCLDKLLGAVQATVATVPACQPAPDSKVTP